jgi:ankyrin repeat protein
LGQSCDPNIVSNDQHTPLQLSIAFGELPIFGILLNHPKTDINQITDKGTAFYFAIKTEKWDFAQVLLDKGARPELGDNDGVSALSIY